MADYRVGRRRALQGAGGRGYGLRLPFYYSLTKYVSVGFVVSMLLLLAWSHPAESVLVLAGRFAWLLLTAAALIALHFLVLEDEAGKLLQAQRALAEQAARARFLLRVDNRVVAAGADRRHVARQGLLGISGLLPVRRGLVALIDDSGGGPRVAAALHLSRDRAAALADACARGEVQDDWLVVPLPASNGRRLGFLAVELRVSGAGDRARRDMIDLLARNIGAALETELLHRRLARLSVTDAMTGLYNHRHYCERADGEMARAARHGQSLAFMISDIDLFKEHVDRRGHLPADRTLNQLGRLVRGCVRRSDLVARWGGDEFAYLLPDTGREGAAAVARKIQQVLAGRRFPDAGGDSLTFSFGIAVYPEDGRQWRVLVGQADSALFTAKKEGRDRIAFAGGGCPPADTPGTP